MGKKNLNAMGGRNMQASTRPDRLATNGLDTTVASAQVLTAYLEKSAVVQTVIRDLVSIIANDRLPAQERNWAATALQEALFCQRTPPQGESKRADVEAQRQAVPGLCEAHRRLEEEEGMFAANLARLLAEKNVSQAELALRVGVGPSAISMMLSRRCRPQRRTLEKIAQALGAELRELWPS
jgi:lambda repressor-like predicted transcriptional regulator